MAFDSADALVKTYARNRKLLSLRSITNGLQRIAGRLRVPRFGALRSAADQKPGNLIANDQFVSPTDLEMTSTFGPAHAKPLVQYLIFHWSRPGVLMYPRRPTVFSAVLIFPMILAGGASAQAADRMKATAMEKMMPADKAAKMRECEKRAAEQKIKMEDRSRFVDECVWRKTK